MDHLLTSVGLALLVTLGGIGLGVWLERRKRELPEVPEEASETLVDAARYAGYDAGPNEGDVADGAGDFGGDFGGDGGGD